MRKLVIVTAIILCLLLVSCNKPEQNDVLLNIRAEIAEEYGLPTEAVFIIDIKDCSSDNAEFYIIEVLIEDDEYFKATYAVQIDEYEDGLHIMEWQLKEKY